MSNQLLRTSQSTQIVKIKKELTIISKLLPSTNLEKEKWEWWNGLSDVWKKIFIVNLRFNRFLEEEGYIDFLFEKEHQSYGDERYNTPIELWELEFILEKQDKLICQCGDSYIDFQIDSLEPLIRLKNLKEINFSGFKIKNVNFEFFKNIERVSLNSIYYQENEKDYGVCITYDHCYLNNQRELKIHNSNSLVVDSNYKIKQLELDNNYLLDTSFLSLCPNLEKLNINCNVVDLNLIANLKNIKRLSLGRCGLTSSSILILGKLSNLESLDLRNVYNYTNYYHCDCFEPINVDYSKIVNNDIREWAIFMLKEKLPNCTIYYDKEDAGWTKI